LHAALGGWCKPQQKEALRMSHAGGFLLRRQGRDAIRPLARLRLRFAEARPSTRALASVDPVLLNSVSIGAKAATAQSVLPGVG
jgi:hypothetical protein